MRILLAHKNWYLAGGVEGHLFDVAEWLTSRGHEVIPFSMQNPRNTVNSPAFVSPVDMRATSIRERMRSAERALLGSQTRRKARELVTGGIDAAYVGHIYHQMGFSFLKDLSRAGVPIVLSLHDYKLGCANYQLINERTNESCTVCIDRRIGYLYGPLATRCSGTSLSSSALLTLEGALSRWSHAYSETASVVTVVNRLQRDAAVAFGISDDRIMRIPHYVEEPRGPVRWRPERKQKVALFVGRLSPEKRVDTLIRASALSRTRVRIVGDGRLAPDLRRLAESLHAPVEFVGWLGKDGVTSEMEQADALVLPSSSEVWGLVANEAITAGLPVIASDVGALSELLAGGRGHLFPVGDSAQLASILARLQAGDDRFKRSVEAAREYASRELSRAQWEVRLQRAFERAGVEV